MRILQFIGTKRNMVLLLIVILVGMLMTYMFHQAHYGNELFSSKPLVGGKEKCSLVTSPVSSDDKFARFFPIDAYWSQKNIDQMGDDEMLQYLHWSDRASCYLSYDFGGKRLIGNGITGIDGQKAVCMDRGVRPTPGKCLVYSIGVSNDWSFDEQMEGYGCEVFSMDPSLGKEDHNHSAHIHFYNMGLGPTNTDKNHLGWKMRTFANIYEMLKQQHGEIPIDILKADIEGAEFDVIPSLIESGILDNVKQIALEVHLNYETLREKLKTLKLLEDQGFVRFALRPNIFFTSEILGTADHLLYEMAWYNAKYKEANPVILND